MLDLLLWTFSSSLSGGLILAIEDTSDTSYFSDTSYSSDTSISISSNWFSSDSCSSKVKAFYNYSSNGTVSFRVVRGSSSRIWRSPPMHLEMTLEQVSPTPMDLSFTRWIDFLEFSSPKMFIIWGILSLEITWPLLHIVVWNRVFSQFNFMTINPFYWLNFTAFWIMLKMVSWYFFQSITKDCGTLVSFSMLTFMFLLLIWC